MNEKDNKVQALMDVTMEKVRAMVDVDSVIGSPITTPDGTTIIPISRVNYGFGVGGSDLPSKAQPDKGLFGGGSGVGVTVNPIAFLVISGGNVRVLQIEPYFSPIDRIVANAPDVVDRIAQLFRRGEPAQPAAPADDPAPAAEPEQAKE